MIKLDYKNIKDFILEEELLNLKEKVKLAHHKLHNKSLNNNSFLGWLDLPFNFKEENMLQIEELAKEVIKNSEILIVIGIGGSYLGAASALCALKPNFYDLSKDKFPKIFFAGINLSSDYLNDLLTIIQNKEIYLNVISKSGTTIEPALTFRILKDFLEKRYGKKEASRRIIATTSKNKGALRELALKYNYRTLNIPEDIGGRFSVLTEVGFFPLKVAGIDIREILKGAMTCAKLLKEEDLEKNPAYLYAGIRYLFYQKKKIIEILAVFSPKFQAFSQWWTQLFGESEGKNHKGIFPARAAFSTDLHSLGQLIQEGIRNIFETFLWIEKEHTEIKIPESELNLDNLNYLKDKSLNYINEQAFKGTARAHLEGGVPNLTISLPELSEFHLGELFYFFEKSVAISGYLLEINPFDQPGVEKYKKNMLTLLKTHN